VLVTVPSLSPRRSGTSASIRFRLLMLLSPKERGLSLRDKEFRGHNRVHLRYGPVTRTFPQGRSVYRLQVVGFSRTCYPSYGASDSCPGGTVSRLTSQPS